MPRRFGRQIPYPRKDKAWVALPGLSANLFADGNSAAGTLQFEEKVTVMRMLGEVLLTPNSAPVATDLVDIGFGIGIFADTVSTAAQFPSAIAAQDFPWLVQWNWALYFREGAAGETIARNIRWTYDIKSRRIVPTGSRLVMILTYADGAGAPPIRVEASPVRVLVAE